MEHPPLKISKSSENRYGVKKKDSKKDHSGQSTLQKQIAINNSKT